MKSGNLNFLEPSGPLRTYNGTALHFFLRLPIKEWHSLMFVLSHFSIDFNTKHGDIFCRHVWTALDSQGLFIVEASRSHSHAPHSVEFLWTSDKPVAKTSTWQHTTLTRDRPLCPGGIRTRSPSKRAAVNQRLKSERPPGWANTGL